MRTLDAEVIVVGAGPAGSATAMLLARQGHDVLLLDKSVFPRHKACSEYVNPGGVKALQELGLLEDALSHKPHRMTSMRVHAPAGQTFLADFDRAGDGQFALGLSRFRLDKLLVDNAIHAGASICDRAHVRDVRIAENDSVSVDATIAGERRTLTASLIVGADGHHSVVSRSLGLDRSPRWPQRTGLIAHFRDVQPAGTTGEMYVDRHGYAGIAPLENGITNVAFVSNCQSVSDREGSVDKYFMKSLDSIPGVRTRLEGASQVGIIRGVGPMARSVARPCGSGYVLVGDAAGFVDPFTGDGVYEALKAAQLAAPIISNALRHGDTSSRRLDEYRALRRRTFTSKRQVSLIIQAFIHIPAMMDYATPRLQERADLGRILTGVLGNFTPARHALSPIFLGRLLRP
ncbi:NAD(P)/FAD-dependent oxidoreductase [soil metagenome]